MGMLPQGSQTNPDFVCSLHGLATSNEIVVSLTKSSVEVEDRLSIFQTTCHENIHGVLTVIHVISALRGIGAAKPSSDPLSRIIS